VSKGRPPNGQNRHKPRRRPRRRTPNSNVNLITNNGLRPDNGQPGSSTWLENALSVEVPPAAGPIYSTSQRAQSFPRFGRGLTACALLRLAERLPSPIHLCSFVVVPRFWTVLDPINLYPQSLQKVSELRIRVRLPSPAPVISASSNNLAIGRGGKSGNKSE
jgi:hypothetical protein